MNLRSRRNTSLPVRVGVVGCGNVSAQYLHTLSSATEVDIAACADLDPAAAGALADRFGVPRVLPVSELLADPGIDLVLNLTPPTAHASVSRDAIEAAKHVYSEKPIALDIREARDLLALAAARGVYVGCAPDTVLGPGLAACRELVHSGALGTVISANALMMAGGPERFHTAPEFLYRAGAGPLFDGGPYYVTALVALLGRVARVAAFASRTRDTRKLLAGPRAGGTFPVETPTHVAATLEFASGVIATLVASFDVLATRTSRLEVHGTEASLLGPAPNSWGGPVALRRAEDADFVDIGVAPVPENMLGTGVVEMAQALRAGAAPAADAARAVHVLEVLSAIEASAAGGVFVEIPAGDGGLA